MEENACPIDILVDLSIPEPEALKNGSFVEDKENNDPIEISRSDDSDRRLSITLEKPLVAEHRILKDVTKSLGGNSERRGLDDSEEIQLLDEETFDFDLVLSPQEKKVDETEEVDGDEEVFFGPVGFTEQIVAATVAEDDMKPMSPLNPAQIAEMVKEAHLVACQFSSMKNSSSSEDSKSPTKRALFSPSGKAHVRKGTFRMEVDEVKKQPEKVRRSIPCIDFSANNVENMPQNIVAASALSHDRQSQHTTNTGTSMSQRTVGDHKNTKEGEKKPSRLSKLTRNRSFTIKKTASKENIEPSSGAPVERVRHPSSSSDTASETCSVASDNSDVSFTRPSKVRQSLQNTLKGGKTSKLQAPSGLKRSNSLVKSRSGGSTLTASNIQKASPSLNRREKNGHKRTHSNSSNSSVGSTASNKSQSQLPNPAGGKPALPITKLQLMQPGKLQKGSLAFNRSKLSEASNKKPAGPMRAVVPPEDKVNNRMKTRGTPVKPDKLVQPKNLSNSFTTPVKSGSTSSYGPSTPMSDRKEKRRSFLPTPSKSSTSSAPPASPFSMRSSVSSNSSFGSRKSLSLTSESPVFVVDKQSTSRRRIPSGNKKSFAGLDEFTPSALKPRKAIVRHTPDIPKQQASRWSPIRRNRQLSAEEQAMQCTKRKY